MQADWTGLAISLVPHRDCREVCRGQNHESPLHPRLIEDTVFALSFQCLRVQDTAFALRKSTAFVAKTPPLPCVCVPRASVCEDDALKQLRMHLRFYIPKHR